MTQTLFAFDNVFFNQQNKTSNITTKNVHAIYRLDDDIPLQNF